MTPDFSFIPHLADLRGVGGAGAFFLRGAVKMGERGLCCVMLCRLYVFFGWLLYLVDEVR